MIENSSGFISLWLMGLQISGNTLKEKEVAKLLSL